MAFSLRKRKHDSNIPTDSLSDVAFLLIIFFILTTSIRKLTGFKTDLPAADKAVATQKTPTVGLNGGQVRWDDKVISMAELKLKLEDLKLAGRPSAERVVLLDSSADVGYQNYFEVMSLITAANGVVGILSEETGK